MASNKMRGITVEIGGDTSKLGTALKDVNKSSKDLQRELRGVNTMLKYDPKNVTLVQQKQDILTQSVEKTREKLSTLKEAQAQVQEQFDKGEITQEQYRDFQREIIYTENQLKDLESQLKETTQEQKSFAESAGMAAEKLAVMGEKMVDTGKDLTKRFTVPLAAVGGVAAKLGVDFEKAMSEVAAVSGATADEMEVLEKAARDAGATTDKSARDAADALQYMALAGWDVETSQKALMPMLKLSSAANMELGRTSDLVTDTMAVLGLEIEDLDGYLDVLAETSRNSNTNVDQLGEAFLVTGSRLSMLEVPVQEGAVALGILANNGIKGSEAGRGLNAVLTNLTAPTGRAQKALEELGVSAFDSNGEFIGIEETLQLVEDATKDMTQEQKNMYYSMIAGKEHSKTFNALMGSLGDGFQDLRADVMGADGALEEMYDTATDNTMGAINNLKSALEELSLKIFDSLKPTIDSLVAVVQSLTDWFNNLSPGVQEAIVKFAVLLGALGPILIIGGKIAIGLSKIITIGLKLGGIMKAGIGLIAALQIPMLPLIAVIAAVAAAVAGAVLVFKNWGAISEWLVDKFGWLIDWFHETFGPFIEDAKFIIGLLVEVLTELLDGFIEHITIIFNFMKETVSEIVTTLVEIVKTLFFTMVDNIVLLLQGFLTIIGNIFNILYQIIKAPVELIVAFATGGFEGLKNKSIEIFNNLKGNVGNIFEAIKNMVFGIVTNIKNAVVNIFKSMVTGAVNVFKGFLGSVRNIFTNIGNTIKRLAKVDLTQIGRDIIKGLASGITGAIGWVNDAVVGVAKSITSGFKSFFGIKSPSRLMRDVVGKMIPQGIAVGVEADTDEALEAVDDMNKEIQDAITVGSDADMVTTMSGSDAFLQKQRMEHFMGSIGDQGSMGLKLDRLVEVFDRYLDKLSDPNYQVVLDNGVLVGELKNDMDLALGRNQDMKGRGR